ncbi:MAG TPA: hypothetical protein VF268_09340, partial [Gammaproteobacteria bacterium]
GKHTGIVIHTEYFRLLNVVIHILISKNFFPALTLTTYSAQVLERNVEPKGMIGICGKILKHGRELNVLF